jgi:hypothetical protein
VNIGKFSLTSTAKRLLLFRSHLPVASALPKKVVAKALPKKSVAKALPKKAVAKALPKNVLAFADHFTGRRVSLDLVADGKLQLRHHLTISCARSSCRRQRGSSLCSRQA